MEIIESLVKNYHPKEEHTKKLVGIMKDRVKKNPKDEISKLLISAHQRLEAYKNERK